MFINICIKKVILTQTLISTNISTIDISYNILVFYFAYIQKGLVRKYGYDDEGKEVTCDFVWEGDVVNSYESYVLGTPSRLKVEAVTDCVLYRFNRDMREKFIMASSNEEIAKLMDMIESIYLHKLRREISYSRCNELERFKLLIDNNPRLLVKTQRNHIASYIGVTQQTINRWLREIPKPREAPLAQTSI